MNEERYNICDCGAKKLTQSKYCMRCYLKECKEERKKKSYKRQCKRCDNIFITGCRFGRVCPKCTRGQGGFRG